MILDTLQFAFHPHPEQFHTLALTDTTLYPRVAGSEGTTAIAIRAVLEGRKGERLASDTGGYTPGAGMETPYNKKHLLGQEGEVVCLGWTALPDGVKYRTLRLRSTQPIVVHELTWQVDTEP